MAMAMTSFEGVMYVDNSVALAAKNDRRTILSSAVRFRFNKISHSVLCGVERDLQKSRCERALAISEWKSWLSKEQLNSTDVSWWCEEEVNLQV